MANFYTDHPEIKFNLESSPLMQRIVELKENGYADKDSFDYAPEDYADAIDSYNRVLEVAGDITANTIFPNSEDVDAEGPHCEDGRVRYASKTYENLEATRKAGLNGVTMPRRFGGLNFPITAYTAINEMIASADAGFENIWSLQDCIETLYEFGDEDQRSRFIPRVCAGETMSMDLTEPDAGSDLQRVMLKATYSEEDKCWYLVSHKRLVSTSRVGESEAISYVLLCVRAERSCWGVKRFITNGDSDIHLVLARSEEGTRDGRGLSMFIYDNCEHKATRINESCVRERGEFEGSSYGRAERSQ